MKADWINLTPMDYLMGRVDEKLKVCEERVQQAIKARRIYWEENRKAV